MAGSVWSPPLPRPWGPMSECVGGPRPESGKYLSPKKGNGRPVGQLTSEQGQRALLAPLPCWRKHAAPRGVLGVVGTRQPLCSRTGGGSLRRQRRWGL